MAFRNGLALLLWTCVASSGAVGFDFDSVAFGYGQSFVSKDEQFRLGEVFSFWNLHPDLNLGRDWLLRPRVDISAGWLARAHDYGFIGRVGPDLRISRKGFPVSLAAGFSPTYIAQTRYGDRDFSIPLQFTTDVGIDYEPTAHVGIGYRFEHMSNAGLGDHNPGVNLHVLMVAFRF